LTHARQNTKPIQLLTCETILRYGVCSLYSTAFLLSNKSQSWGYFVVKFNISSFREQNLPICHCEPDFLSPKHPSVIASSDLSERSNLWYDRSIITGQKVRNPKQKKGKFNSSQQNTNDQNGLELGISIFGFV